MLVEIDRIKVGDRIRKDYGDIQELAEDIKENGLLNALVVTSNGDGTYTLIAGERRLRAMRDILGFRQTDVNPVSPQDAEQALLMEISENECRKEFTKTERLEYARRLARIEAAKAKERMEAGKAQDPTENSPQGETREIVAKQLGTSSNTIAREQYISDNRDLLDPADFADWDEGRLSTNKAYQRIKAAQAQAERERDAARRELEDAYRAGEAMEAEAASLRRQLAERPAPEVVERTVEVEVVPDDYAEMKRQIEHLKYDNALNSKDNQRMRRRIEEKNDEIDRLKVLVDGKYHKDNASWDIRVLTTATNSYLSQYGGKLWAFDQFDHADEVTREEFVKAMTSLAAFSQNLLEMLREKGN